ncbi:MAG: GDP-mannose 4,6-dehydratase [Bacteroidetes bacterium]|nr:GDP-mannose 4,6-dehydratase [Bacteroidota bacterium]
MKTAIITGITGQDGAYLSALLLQKEYRVVGIIRSYNNSNLSKLRYLNIADKINLEECDLSDIPSIISILKKYKPSELYNLAAQSSVGLSFEQPIGTITFNSISVLNLLESIKIVNKDIRFYQASSSEMYGKVARLPITEETPMHPLSPYAISKATAYWSVVNYRESYGLYACNGVLFNHESHLRTENFFVKKVISQAVAIKKGKRNEMRVGNIDIKRDFGYAPEYVKAMWAILQQDQPQDFLICSGRSVSLREIAEYVFRKLDISISKIISDPVLFRPTDIKDIFGDHSKARKTLGWEYDLSFFDVLDKLIEEEMHPA